MIKKLCSIILTAALLTACAGREQGSDLYGNSATGGWRDDVNITDLQATGMTKDFRSDVKDYVLFAFNSAALSAEAKDSLKAQIDWLKAHPNVLIVIEGRCDERGTTEYNIALGDSRANAVRRYLVANGIASNRIKTISFGKDDPVALGSTPAAWAENRRGTTVVY